MNEPSEEVVKAGYSKSLMDCDPRIQNAYPLVRDEFCAAHPGLDLQLDYTYRSPALQMELFKKGRTQDAAGQWILTDRKARVTDKDGTIKKGEHNFYPSLAADVYIRNEKELLWPFPVEHPDYHARHELYVALGHLWEKHGLISGATWQYAWKDDPHVQVAQAA